eukprot:EST47595.1 Hypothetical protein SS50377_12287 [Spironucleus salmonicida]
MSPTQLIIGCLVMIPTLIASTNFQEAITLADALQNDITTQIQDYHLDSYFKQNHTTYLQLLKIFKNKIQNSKNYLDIINILRSVAYEGLGNYKASLQQIQAIAETDKSIQLACLRIKFNLIYQQSKEFLVPMFEMAKNNISSMISEIKQLQSNITKVSKNTLFDYDQSLIQYVSTLYLSRIHTLINSYEQANIYYTELWQLSPDDESYEESIVAYLDNFVRYAGGDKNDCSLVTKSPLHYHFHSNKIRPEVVNQALQIATEFANVKDKQQLNAIAYYYMGHLKILLKDYDGAVGDLRKSKELNQTQYKYPSELVSVAWLPSMIDFDLLSVMLLSGRKEICQVNQPNYFEKIIQNKNILIQLSTDRQEMAQILHILFNFQRKFHDNSLLSNEDVVHLLVKVGMLDDKFFPNNTEFYYVEPTINNCHIMVQVYLLAIYFIESQNYEIGQFCRDKIKDLIGEFPELELVQTILKSKQNMQQDVQIVPTVSYTLLLMQTQKRKTFLENVQKWIMKQQPPTSESRRIQVYTKCLQSSPDTAINLSNLLQDVEPIRILLKCYKSIQVTDIIQNQTDSFSIIIKAFLLYENKSIGQAIELLEKTVYLTQVKEKQQLVYFNLAKLNVLNNTTEDGINILQVLEQTVSKSTILYNSVIFDLILAYEEISDVNKALQLGSQHSTFNILKTMIVFKQFQFGIDYETMENLLKNYVELNEFDSLVIRAILHLKSTQDQDGYFQQLFTELLNRIPQFQKIFEQPKTQFPSPNYFTLEIIEQEKMSSSLLPQFSPISIFLSDIYDKKYSILFFVSLCCSLALILDQQIDFALIEPFFGVRDNFHSSWANNVHIYLLKFGLESPFMESIQQNSQAEVIQTIEVNQQQHNLLALNFPVNLPKIYEKQEFFNPINQFTVASLVDEVKSQIEPENQTQNNTCQSVLNSVFMLDYTVEVVSPKKQVQNLALEPNKLTLQQLETPQRPLRAKSARPLLKMPKTIQQQKPVVGKPIRAGFRRLKAIQDSGSGDAE